MGKGGTELFDWADEAHARNTDPHTSHDAAHSIPSEKIRLSQQHILNILKTYGPLTDTKIFERIQIKMSPSGARSRRAELVDHRLVVDTGVRERLVSGRLSIVWGVAATP